MLWNTQDHSWSWKKELRDGSATFSAHGPEVWGAGGLRLGLEPGEQGGSQELLVLPKLESTFTAVKGSCDSVVLQARRSLLQHSSCPGWLRGESCSGAAVVLSCRESKGQVIASGDCLQFLSLMFSDRAGVSAQP